MKTYKGFNVLTNKPVGYFTKQEVDRMINNPVYKSISFINETPVKKEKVHKEAEKQEAEEPEKKEKPVADKNKEVAS